MLLLLLCCHTLSRAAADVPMLLPLLHGACPCRQFDSIIQSLNYLRDRSSDTKDSGDVPGRMLVLHHAWFLVNKHPNLRLDEHPAAAVKKVY